MEKSKKPKIRFKGFTDDWEQRELGEVANYRRGSFPQPYGNSEWYDGEGAMPFVQVADVTDNMNLAEDTKQKISKLAQPMSVYAEKDSVLVTLQGSIGRVAIAQYGAFVDRTVLIFEKYKEKIDYSFWAYIVKQKFIEESRKAPGGTIKTITKEALSDFDLYIPQYQEQRRIAEFFKSIDNLITLHQRKLDKLINVKKSMLEKMFPKQGSTVPEIRFSGFTNDWEQRELGDIAPLRGGFAFKSEEYTDTGVPIIRISNILSNGTVGAEFAYYAKQVDDEEYALYDGAALLAMSGATTGKVSVLHAENTDKFYQNQRVGYFTRQKKYDYKFVSTIVRSSLFANQLGAVLVAGAQPNVSAKDIDSFEFMVPPQTKEQAAIGEYFCNLDSLITLHQCELEKLQNIKKSMLEKMFV